MAVRAMRALQPWILRTSLLRNCYRTDTVRTPLIIAATGLAKRVLPSLYKCGRGLPLKFKFILGSYARHMAAEFGNTDDMGGGR